MTPLQDQFHNARKARLARFDAAAYERLSEKAERERQLRAEEYARKQAELRTAYLDLPPFRAEKIAREVCGKHDLSMEDLRSARRSPAKLADARFELYSRLKAETKLTLPQIGKFMNRDHSSVLHGIRRWKELQEQGQIA